MAYLFQDYLQSGGLSSGLVGKNTFVPSNRFDTSGLPEQAPRIYLALLYICSSYHLVKCLDFWA